MKLLFTMCGRAGSKGVKNKNIRDFLGYPLSYFTLSAVLLYIEKHPEDLCDIVVNTDSPELISILTAQKKCDVNVIEREPTLCGDMVPKVSIILNCLQRMQIQLNKEYDIVIDLDITSPLRTIKDVENAIKTKSEKPNVDVVYSVTNSRRNPYFNMVREKDGFFEKAVMSNFTTRQQSPEFFDMNASIYAYSPFALKNKETSGFFNDNCYAIKMLDTAVLDIDSEEDYELMQVVAKYFFEKIPEMNEIYKRTKLISEK